MQQYNHEGQTHTCIKVCINKTRSKMWPLSILEHLFYLFFWLSLSFCFWCTQMSDLIKKAVAFPVPCKLTTPTISGLAGKKRPKDHRVRVQRAALQTQGCIVDRKVKEMDSSMLAVAKYYLQPCKYSNRVGDLLPQESQAFPNRCLRFSFHLTE